MENDIFLMSVAILNAWRTGHVTKNYSAVIASKEFELLKTIVVPKNKFIYAWSQKTPTSLGSGMNGSK
jgi:hypothetical protein